MNPFQQIQHDAVREGLTAKRDYEVEEQRRKVAALADQVDARLADLISRAYDAQARVRAAVDQPLFVGSSMLARDGETVDLLLSALSDESQALDQMRSAKQTTDEIEAKYQAKADAVSEGEGEQPAPEPHGLSVVGVGQGAYL